MDNIKIYCPGTSPALRFARDALAAQGIPFSSGKEPDITHLLLSIPSFDPSGKLKDGEHILEDLNKVITIIGGNLGHPLLAGFKKLDLLQDPYYLAQNCAITAHCALKHLLQQLPVTAYRCPILIIGWGRIGKCLAKLLRELGAEVTVSARKDADLAMLGALGYQAVHTDRIGTMLSQFRAVFNTVPAQVISPGQAELLRPDCVKIDLASVKGIAGDGVIWARGLPGKDAPEASGVLIAETILKYLREGKL